MEKTTDQMIADIQAILDEKDETIEEDAPVRGAPTLRVKPSLPDRLRPPPPPPPRIVLETGEELHIVVQEFFNHVHRAVGEIHMLSTMYPHAQWMVSQSCENYWAVCMNLLHTLSEIENDDT